MIDRIYIGLLETVREILLVCIKRIILIQLFPFLQFIYIKYFIDAKIISILRVNFIYIF